MVGEDRAADGWTGYALRHRVKSAVTPGRLPGHTAYVTVDSRSVVVTSGSNLDPGNSDIGLFVDQEPPVLMDRLLGTKAAIFDAKYARLIDLFKAGARLRVQLRFWPEWPATGTHAATFSLIGFTKAYGELAGCR
jgi:hypothetical protein